MYKDFIEALNKKYNCSGENDLSGMDLQHYKFASTTRQRALNAIETLETCGFMLEGGG